MKNLIIKTPKMERAVSTHNSSSENCVSTIQQMHTMYKTNQKDVNKKIANSVKDNLQKVY